MLTSVPVPLIVVILGGLLVVVLLVIIWSLKRGRDVEFTLEMPALPPGEMLPTFAGLSHGVIVEGNAVELVENGAFFDMLLDDVRAATRSIHFETFLWKEGEIGQRLAEAFAAQSRAGVRVRLLLDANGSKNMGDAERLVREAGCHLVKYHKGRLRNLGQVNNRDHRKIVVLDGRVGYVGGHCVVDSWLGEAQDKEHFRDLSARIRGPVVHGLQSTFSENWVETTGELFGGDDVFPHLEAEGSVPIHVARVSPSGAPSGVKLLHYLAIHSAQERLWIQNPYFLPDPDAIKKLGEAVNRGVDVRVMTPAPEASDSPAVQHAAHHNFDKLLKAGVRLFEYERTLLHQKVMTIDGVWCAIGSSNFDDRSFEINDEVTLGFYDEELARQLETIFERDLEYCTERTLDEWQQRSLRHRLRDAAFYLVNEEL